MVFFLFLMKISWCFNEIIHANAWCVIGRVVRSWKKTSEIGIILCKLSLGSLMLSIFFLLRGSRGRGWRWGIIEIASFLLL
jgi:hypothetical protein